MALFPKYGNIRLGPVLTDRESVPTASCSPVSPLLRFVVTESNAIFTYRIVSRGSVPRVRRYDLLYLRAVEYDHLRTLDSVTIATGIPRFDCHISLYRVKIHISDNFLDTQWRHKLIHAFKSSWNVFIWKFSFTRASAWRGRALFTFVYNCDFIVRA